MACYRYFITMEENASELMFLDFFFLNIDDGLQCRQVQNSDTIMCYWGLLGFRFERQEEPGGVLQVEGITSLTALYCPLEYFLGVWLTLRGVVEGSAQFFSLKPVTGTLPNSFCVNTTQSCDEVLM